MNVDLESLVSSADGFLGILSEGKLISMTMSGALLVRDSIVSDDTAGTKDVKSRS